MLLMGKENILAATASLPGTELLDGLLEPVFLIDDRGVVHYANKRARKLLLHNPLRKMLAKLCLDDAERLSATIKLWGGSQTPRPGMLTFITGADDAPRKLRCLGSRTTANQTDAGRGMILIQCHDTPGEQLGILKTSLHSLQNEVRERRRAQSLAEEALADRDLMLRELQHRVKNNIQVVTALVRTSIRSTTSPEARSVLEKTYARLAAATAVQQLLYQENSFRNIDARQMLENLVSGLASWIGTEHIVHSQADSVPLPNNAALPLGLIINELITNAIKYGRNASGIAEVDISLTCEEGRFCLEVKDKGPGFEWRETAKKASGLGLVRGLVRQLGGSLNIESENGTQTLVEFEAND